jgi:predicted transcriptional regulator
MQMCKYSEVLSKEEVGKLVKEARINKSKIIGTKYTQVMLAYDIDVSQGYIGDIEGGRTYPTYTVICKIAHACEVPLNFFDIVHS